MRRSLAFEHGVSSQAVFGHSQLQQNTALEPLDDQHQDSLQSFEESIVDRSPFAP